MKQEELIFDHDGMNHGKKIFLKKLVLFSLAEFAEFLEGIGMYTDI